MSQTRLGILGKLGASLTLNRCKNHERSNRNKHQESKHVPPSLRRTESTKLKNKWTFLIINAYSVREIDISALIFNCIHLTFY